MKENNKKFYWVEISENDIVVTTPKSEMENAAEEAQRCIQCGGGFYFRRFVRKAKRLEALSKIFYVEDGYIRGFGTVTAINYHHGMRCQTTNQKWDEGYYALMPAQTWRWVEPIRCKGFQGFKYFKKLFPEIKKVKIVGGWKDPKPEKDVR